MRTASKIPAFILISFLVITLFSGETVHARGSVSVALMDLESTNLNHSLTNQVNQAVASETSRRTRTISNGQVLNALNRERLSKSSVLSNPDLTARVGRSVGAQKVLTGLASRVNDIYIITLKLTDVNNQSVRQVTRNHRGNFNQFLSTSVRDAVNELLK